MSNQIHSSQSQTNTFYQIHSSQSKINLLKKKSLQAVQNQQILTKSNTVSPKNNIFQPYPLHSVQKQRYSVKEIQSVYTTKLHHFHPIFVSSRRSCFPN
jgi:hypothetical protein